MKLVQLPSASRWQLHLHIANSEEATRHNFWLTMFLSPSSIYTCNMSVRGNGLALFDAAVPRHGGIVMVFFCCDAGVPRVRI